MLSNVGFLDKVGRFLDERLLLSDEARVALETGEKALEADAAVQAEVLFREVLAQKPGLVRAIVGLAQARLAQGDRAEARKLIDEALVDAPDSGPLALMAARLAFAQSDFEATATAARTAALGFPPDAIEELGEAFELNALAELERGRPDRAAREIRKAIAIAPSAKRQLMLLESCAQASQRAAALQVAAILNDAELDHPSRRKVAALLRTLGAADRGREWLLALTREGDDEAWAPLAALELAEGRLLDAQNAARQALATGETSALETLGDALFRLGKGDEAADAFETLALARRDTDLMRKAVAATPLEAPSLLERRSRALLGQAPNDEEGSIALRWLGVQTRPMEGELAPVCETARGRLLEARTAIEESRPLDALRALDAWSDCASGDMLRLLDLETAEELRRHALRRLWIDPDGEVDLAAAIDAARLFGANQCLSNLERGAAALRDELDRPLLLAILGEFNAGKSTLVNAFIGADVAPMGIVPTTATLNILRAGAEKRVRVVHRDGSTREGDYGSLEHWLDEASSPTAIDHVEIMVPGSRSFALDISAEPTSSASLSTGDVGIADDVLERVWILDTPGTNALQPEHEELALEAARRADAVLWVFDAAQPARATERRILERIRASGREIVAAVNKVDRLPPATLNEVVAVLEPITDGALWPISARQALRARLQGDTTALERSGVRALLEELDRRVFTRSRQLKRAACAGRLLAVLEEALTAEKEEQARLQKQITELEALGERLEPLRQTLEEAVGTALRSLDDAQDRAFDAAATEVLAFVRPRQHRFDRHGVHREDRAFLAELLERSLRLAIAQTRAELLENADEALTAALGGIAELDRARFAKAARSRLGEAFAHFEGYQRGWLLGGRLHHFFEEVLPRAELTLEGIVLGLGRARADAHEELQPRLAEAALAIVGELEKARKTAIRAAQAASDRVHTGLFAPLRALFEVLAEGQRNG